jgi:hypothetical protein
MASETWNTGGRELSYCRYFSGWLLGHHFWVLAGGGVRWDLRLSRKWSLLSWKLGRLRIFAVTCQSMLDMI